jgi:hypothetical protein
MQLTKKDLVFGGTITVLGAGLAVTVAELLIWKQTAPKDTPIVVVGGSIQLMTNDADDIGWTNNGRGYSAFVSRTPANPNIGDKLSFVGFKNNPGVVTGTGGWEISFHNLDTDGTTEKRDEFALCSNANCDTAPAQTTGLCSTAVGDTVYLVPNPRQNSRLYPHFTEIKNGQVKHELDFHDWSALPHNCKNGSGDIDGPCDVLYEVTLTTCTTQSNDYACPNKSGKWQCNICIGNAENDPRCK